MLAVRAARFGGDRPLDNLEVVDVPAPRPGPGDALVKVEAASLNHHDLWTLRGVSSRRLEQPQVLGCDAAGTVVEYGEDAAGGSPAPGTRVAVHAVMACGRCNACRGSDPLHCTHIGILSEPPYPGTLAEQLVVPAANLVPLPDGVALEQAACLPTAYLTAYRMLFIRGAAVPGQRVLVHGPTGGVGSAAILLAAGAGLTVFATSRDEERRAAARELGATLAVAADRDGLRAVTESAGGGVDLVIDTVGEATWDFSLRVLRPGGTLVVSGATSGANPGAQLNRIYWRHLTVAGSSMGTRAELARLVAMVASGRLRPLVDSVRPLADAAEAFALLERGERHGKLVLRPSA